MFFQFRKLFMIIYIHILYVCINIYNYYVYQDNSGNNEIVAHNQCKA